MTVAENAYSGIYTHLDGEDKGCQSEATWVSIDKAEKGPDDVITGEGVRGHTHSGVLSHHGRPRWSLISTLQLFNLGRVICWIHRLEISRSLACRLQEGVQRLKCHSNRWFPFKA